MNPVNALLVELVAIAESPLYSAYRWLGKQLGRNIAFTEFLRVIEDLIRRDVLRLWLVDQSYDRTELFEAPRGLVERYDGSGHDDETYDPFGYSLTLGPSAEVGSEPEWEVEIDFQEGTFELLARNPDLDLENAVAELARFYPDVSLAAVETTPDEEGRRVFGKVSTANSHESPSN